MKKLLLFLLTIVLVLALSACATNQNASGNNGGNNNSSSSSSDITSSTPSPEYVAPSDNNQSNVTTDTKISRDKALEIALNHAGLKQENIRGLDIELDKENGVTVWDVDFESGDIDYSYDINAETGEIVKRETERDD